MRVKVLQTFRDKFNTSRAYKPGEVLDFEEERALNIVKLGLAAPFIPEVPQEVKPQRKPRKKK